MSFGKFVHLFRFLPGEDRGTFVAKSHVPDQPMARRVRNAAVEPRSDGGIKMQVRRHSPEILLVCAQFTVKFAGL